MYYFNKFTTFHSMNFYCLHRFLNVTYTSIGTILKVTVVATLIVTVLAEKCANGIANFFSPSESISSRGDTYSSNPYSVLHSIKLHDLRKLELYNITTH